MGRRSPRTRCWCPPFWPRKGQVFPFKLPLAFPQPGKPKPNRVSVTVTVTVGRRYLASSDSPQTYSQGKPFHSGPFLDATQTFSPKLPPSLSGVVMGLAMGLGKKTFGEPEKEFTLWVWFRPPGVISASFLSVVLFDCRDFSGVRCRDRFFPPPSGFPGGSFN